MDEVIRKRILLIFPDFGFGGAERSIASLSVLLASYYDVHYVVFNNLVSPVYPFAGQPHSLNVTGGNHVVGKAFTFIQRLMRLRSIKNRLQPQASISFLEGSDYLNVLTKRDDKVILCLRGSKRYDPNMKGVMGYLRKRLFIPFVYRRGDKIVSVAQGILDEMEMDFNLPPKVDRTVISNFYSLPDLKLKSQENLRQVEEDFFEKHVVFAAVGRLAYEKGFHLLADVFSMVAKLNPKARLVFIGSGPYEKQIQDRLVRNQISFSQNASNPDFDATVLFLGYQSNPLKWIARAKFFVLSSFTEGFPNVLIESMAAGTPVIAADCPYGPAEILGAPQESTIFCEYGMLLPLLSEDRQVVDQWKNHFVQVMNDNSIYTRYSQKAYARVDQYSKESVLTKWMDVIG